MNALLAINDTQTLPAREPGTHCAGLPDARHDVKSHDGSLTSRCSLWWRNTPQLAGQHVGLIGQYFAEDDESGAAVLTQACSTLADHGCTLAIGPMDGNTWRDYRFVIEGSSQPSFFLEPQNPPAWPQQFTRAGLSPLATYCSSIVDDLDYAPQKARSAVAHFGSCGITLHPLEMSRWEESLKEAHEVTLTSFRKGFLYQPLSKMEFVSLYERIRPFVRPELVLFARHGQKAVGFVFVVPDHLQAQRGNTVDTVILKTIAVLPGRAYAGLGWYLTQQAHRTARRLGYRKAIHALMHESNVSLNISSHYGKIFRRYALYAKPL